MKRHLTITLPRLVLGPLFLLSAVDGFYFTSPAGALFIRRRHRAGKRSKRRSLLRASSGLF